MTKPEYSKYRSLRFSQWIRENLPDSNTGFSVSDLDFILINFKTKKVMLLEVKLKNGQINWNQYNMWLLINRWITNGIGEGWVYLGFHLIQFTGLDFSDGKVKLDNEFISEEDLIKFLSF
jgi:hypothetical protein